MRFAFGRNWRRYARHVDEARIETAVSDLLDLTGPVEGQTFLDVGCGSGLSSLAAVRAGAARVLSFDYDEDSVATTRDLRRRFAPDAEWEVTRGDILDPGWVQGIGSWDVVYSWGVLHHTGDLEAACDAVAGLVAPHGVLGLAIYNDQGTLSAFWKVTKRLYVRVPPLRPLLLLVTFVAAWGGTMVYDIRHLRNPLVQWRDYGDRGMAAWNDIVDWAGGYPFEVASPAWVTDRFRDLGFELVRLDDVAGGRGCNQFRFRRSAS